MDPPSPAQLQPGLPCQHTLATHLQTSIANLYINCCFTQSFTSTHLSHTNSKTLHMRLFLCFIYSTQCISYFLRCQIMHSLFISSLVSIFKPLHTIIATSHSVTRRIQGLVQPNGSQGSLCAVVCETHCHLTLFFCLFLSYKSQNCSVHSYIFYFFISLTNG